MSDIDKKIQDELLEVEGSIEAVDTGEQLKAPESKPPMDNNLEEDLTAEKPSDLAVDDETGYAIDDINQLESEIQSENKYDSQNLKAAALAAARGLSLGLSDQALVKSGLFKPEELNALKEANPYISGATEAAAFVAPLVSTGGVAGTAGAAIKGVGKASKLTEKVIAKAIKDATKSKAEKRLASKIIEKTLPQAAGSAVEGAAFGTGQIISENALGNAELNAENLVAGAGLGAITGAVLGGVFGPIAATAPVVSRGVAKRVSKSLRNTTDFDSAMARTIGMTKAQQSKIAQRDPNFFKDLAKVSSDSGSLKVISDSRTLQEGLERVRENAGKRISILIKDADDIFSKAPDTLPTKAAFAEKTRRRILEDLVEPGRLSDGTLSIGAKGTLNKISPLLKELDDLSKAGGTLKPSDIRKLRQGFDEAAAQNKVLGAKSPLEEANWIAAKSSRETLEDTLKLAPGQIAENESNILSQLLESNRQFNITSRALETLPKKVLSDSSKPLVGFSDAVGLVDPYVFAGMQVRKFLTSDIKDRIVVLSQIEKQGNKVINSIDSAVDRFLKVGKKVGRVSRKAATPVTFKVLQETTLDLGGTEPKKGETRREAFQRVSREIENKINNPEKTQEAFTLKTMKMRRVAPKITESLEGTATRALGFLNAKLPKPDPTPNTLQPQIYKKTFMPSDSELAKFERYVKATVDPLSTIDDLADGDLTREGVEAIRTVYPKIYNEIRQKVMDTIQEKPEELNYNQRIQLGILLDLPTDASLVPKNLIALQSQYAPQQGSMPAGPGSSGSNASGTAPGAVRPTVGGLKQLSVAGRQQTGLTKTVTRE